MVFIISFFPSSLFSRRSFYVFICCCLSLCRRRRRRRRRRRLLIPGWLVNNFRSSFCVIETPGPADKLLNRSETTGNCWQRPAPNDVELFRPTTTTCPRNWVDWPHSSIDSWGSSLATTIHSGLFQADVNSNVVVVVVVVAIGRKRPQKLAIEKAPLVGPPQSSALMFRVGFAERVVW